MKNQATVRAIRADFRAIHGFAATPSLLRVAAASMRHSGTLSCVILRVQQEFFNRGFRKLSEFLRSVNIALTGADFASGCVFGGGLRVLHPNGIVVGHAVVVGDNCTLMQQCTLGAARVQPGEVDGFPTLGHRVTVSAGARILGPIRIGDGSVVGANAVVLDDVPGGHVAIGVPARVRPLKEES